MAKDPTIAIRDRFAEIAILHEIEARTKSEAFRSDPIVRRAAAYAIQTISEHSGRPATKPPVLRRPVR